MTLGEYVANFRDAVHISPATVRQTLQRPPPTGTLLSPFTYTAMQKRYRTRETTLKTLSLSLIVGFAAFGSVAQAGELCPTYVCRPPAEGGGGSNASVPEPATLALLGAGIAAAGVAAARRRGKNNKKK